MSHQYIRNCVCVCVCGYMREELEIRNFIMRIILSMNANNINNNIIIIIINNNNK